MKKIAINLLCAATIAASLNPLVAAKGNKVVTHKNTVNVKNKIASPVKKATKSNKAAKPTKSVKPVNSNESVKIGTSQIPCPLVNYNTLDEARKAVGFTFAVPSVLPDGYKMKDIIVISNNLAEVFYRKDDKTVLYRTAKGNADISGDYTVYSEVKTISVGNDKVTCKGSNGKVKLTTWTNNGISFSLSFDEAVNQNELLEIMKSIK